MEAFDQDREVFLPSPGASPLSRHVLKRTSSDSNYREGELYLATTELWSFLIIAESSDIKSFEREKKFHYSSY